MLAYGRYSGNIMIQHLVTTVLNVTRRPKESPDEFSHVLRCAMGDWTHCKSAPEGNGIVPWAIIALYHQIGQFAQWCEYGNSSFWAVRVITCMHGDNSLRCGKMAERLRRVTQASTKASLLMGEIPPGFKSQSYHFSCCLFQISRILQRWKHRYQLLVCLSMYRLHGTTLVIVVSVFSMTAYAD
jgi:hypothetical protein